MPSLLIEALMPKHLPGISLTTSIPLLVVSYLILVRSIRYKRMNAVNTHFSYLLPSLSNNGVDKSSKMTPDEAQRILSPLILYEMPTLINYALAFALFKTYGIPSISKILLKTGQLSSNAGVSRRYADTEILISTWSMCPLNGAFADTTSPDLVVPATSEAAKLSQKGNDNVADDSENMVHQVPDPRSSIAIARVNYLHSKYKITNDDYLYTLALFILEGRNWAAKWGWRSLTPLEEQATLVFWKDVGTRMGIQQIPETLQELESWSKNYEATHMVPSPSNKAVASFTASELIYPIPHFLGLKSLAYRLIWTLMEPRVRVAMMQPEQPWITHALVDVMMKMQKYTLRYLALPRRKPKSVVDPNLVWKGLDTRFHPNWFQPTPWYKPTSPSSIMALSYWRDKLLVALGIHSAMPSEQLASEGYRLDQQGPVQMEGSGQQEVLNMADQLLRFGCPMGKGAA